MMIDSTSLEKMWRNYYKYLGFSTLNQLAPFYQNGVSHLLSRRDREGFYGLCRTIVKKIERQHFRKEQTGQLLREQDHWDYRTDRTLQLIEWFGEDFPWPEYSSQGVVEQYRRAFSRFEAVLQFQRLGISLVTEDKKTLKAIKGHWMVTCLIDYSMFVRSGFTDLYDFYINRYQRIPAEDAYARYLSRMETFLLTLRNSGVPKDYKLVGFRRSTSLFMGESTDDYC